MRWMIETLYIMRDATGAVIRIQEDKPDGYIFTYEQRRQKSTSAAVEVEKSIKDYAKLKAKKKRLTTGD